jgi:signal peptidase
MNIKKISNIFSKAIIILLTLVAVFLAATILPIPGNIKIFTVMSGSMEPTIKIGGIVVVKPTLNYKVGDIISFSADINVKSSITHRVTAINQKGSQTIYTVKGDANDVPDSNPVKKENVIGRVLFTIPWIGYALVWARQPLVFMAIIFIPAIAIIYGEFEKIFAELNKPKIEACEGQQKI